MESMRFGENGRKLSRMKLIGKERWITESGGKTLVLTELLCFALIFLQLQMSTESVHGGSVLLKQSTPYTQMHRQRHREADTINTQTHTHVQLHGCLFDDSWALVNYWWYLFISLYCAWNYTAQGLKTFNYFYLLRYSLKCCWLIKIW